MGTSYIIYALLILAMGGAFDAKTLNDDQNTFQNACFGSKFIVVVGASGSAVRPGRAASAASAA